MENCENLKKMSFKGLEKRPRIFSPYVAILRYLDLACLPLYIFRIPVNCKQCEHYYQSRLDDGFTNDQVEEMKNRISKHRGLFKPPLTPERFWDPDIIEDSANDPRNKIFHASPLRKRREEKAFEVGEVVNGDEFE